MPLTGLSLWLCGVLLAYCTENVGYFALELVPFQHEDRTARVQNHVHGQIGQQRCVHCDGGAHAALDAIAVMRLAHDFAYGQANARAGVRLTMQQLGGMQAAFRHGVAAGAEPRHLAGVLLAGCGVGTLVVRVFPQAQLSKRDLRFGDGKGHCLQREGARLARPLQKRNATGN